MPEETSAKASTEFSVGERVLCYEPDPAKVEVVYDAKILKITPDVPRQYLVHFQGWSASWDRFVTRDFLLKDTEETRQLQRTLFKRAEVCIKLPKPRKNKSKKRKSDGGSNDGDVTKELKAETSAAAEKVSNEEKDASAAENDDACKERPFPLPLSDGVKAILEKDRYNVVERGQLNSLPATVNVVTVLEDFVRIFSLERLNWHEKHYGKNIFVGLKKETAQESLEQVLTDINLAREVAEGLRIMFDLYLQKFLLYHSSERKQLEELMSKPLSFYLKETPGQLSSSGEPCLISSPLEALPFAKIRDVGQASSRRDSKSDEVGKGGGSSHSGSDRSSPSVCAVASVASVSSAETLHRVTSDREFVNKWRLLPSSLVERIQDEKPLPSLVYSPVYLLRLFVTVPEILPKMCMPVERCKILLKYFNLVLSHFEKHCTFS